jgi:hypothetical protein
MSLAQGLNVERASDHERRRLHAARKVTDVIPEGASE